MRTGNLPRFGLQPNGQTFKYGVDTQRQQKKYRPHQRTVRGFYRESGVVNRSPGSRGWGGVNTTRGVMTSSSATLGECVRGIHFNLHHRIPRTHPLPLRTIYGPWALRPIRVTSSSSSSPCAPMRDHAFRRPPTPEDEPSSWTPCVGSAGPSRFS